MKYAAACCTVKNEEALIQEWMAFHKAVGFDHLIIIDHASTDRTAELVENFCDQSSVSIHLWDKPGTQMDMYNFVVNNYKDQFRWCAFIDADEFLFPSVEFDIKSVLVDYEAYDAVGVNWLIYGSSGHLTTRSGPTITNYQSRAEANFIANRHVKSIVNFSADAKAQTSHYFSTINGTVDENGELLPSNEPHGFFEHRTPSHKRLRINHYHTRSREDYAKKAQRGFFGSDDAKLADDGRREVMFQHHDQNQVEDSSALRYLKLMTFYLTSQAGPILKSKLEENVISVIRDLVLLSLDRDKDVLSIVRKHVIELMALEDARLAASTVRYALPEWTLKCRRRKNVLTKALQYLNEEGFP